MGKGALRYRSEADMPASMRGLLQKQVTLGVDVAKRGEDVTIAAFEARGDTVLCNDSATLTRHARHRAGEMNKTEARYAQHLEARRIAGEIAWWAFEPMKLRLAEKTYLTVDFLVKLTDGATECHEVKGRKGDGFWAEEDAKVKIKVAAERYPIFRFRIVWPAKGGGWSEKVLAQGVMR